MLFCQRCGKRFHGSPSTDGSLALCSDCTLQPTVCQAFQHQYQGTGNKYWICLICGKKLDRQVISTAVVPAAKPDVYMDC